jgi:hypothetical protein
MPVSAQGCQQGVNASHGYNTQCRAPVLPENGPIAAKTRNSPHSTDMRRCDHNPRVGGSSPSSGIGLQSQMSRFRGGFSVRVATEVATRWRLPSKWGGRRGWTIRPGNLSRSRNMLDRPPTRVISGLKGAFEGHDRAVSPTSVQAWVAEWRPIIGGVLFGRAK